MINTSLFDSVKARSPVLRPSRFADSDQAQVSFKAFQRNPSVKNPWILCLILLPEGLLLEMPCWEDGHVAESAAASPILAPAEIMLGLGISHGLAILFEVRLLF